jgi:hypothetical protein
MGFGDRSALIQGLIGSPRLTERQFAQRPRKGRQPSATCPSPPRTFMTLQPSAPSVEGSPISAVFSDLPPKPPRSKLEPHLELIRELRRKGQTYRGVARLFQERLGLSVAPSTLHSFVKVRAKHRKRIQFELPPVEVPVPESSPADRIAALKARSSEQPRKASRFVFRENEPLTLTSRGGEQ